MKREKISPRVRNTLVAQARGGCFTHRLTWLPRQLEDSALFMPLDVHHVVFVSAGGGNSPENLIPLCPLCHRVAHQTGKLGDVDATPIRIREEWLRWLSLATLADETWIGEAGDGFEVLLRLNIYHVTVPFLIGRGVTYAAARQRMIAHILKNLRDLDAHCPFGARVQFPEFWECTADRFAPKPWEDIAARVVFEQVQQPIGLIAPIPTFASANCSSLHSTMLLRMDRSL